MSKAIVAQSINNDQVSNETAPRLLRKLELTKDQLGLVSFEADHDGNARAVYSLYGESIRYNDSMGWLWWNGTCWEKNRQAVRKAIVETLRLRGSYAQIANNDKVAQRCIGDVSNINGTMTMLETYTLTEIKEFDTEADFLPTPNGIVDLRTGKLYDHDPKRGFTWNTTAAYNPEADYTEWEELLKKNVAGGEETVNALKMWTGYMLTGHTSDEKVAYLHGPSRAGKGLFKESVKKLLPDPIAQEKSFNTFTAKKDEDTDNFDLASLRSARMVLLRKVTATNRSTPLKLKTCRAEMRYQRPIKVRIASGLNQPSRCAFSPTSR